MAKAKEAEENIMPDDGMATDVSDLRVNFSTEEAESKAFDFSPVPTGLYLCNITEYEVRYSTSEKNPGKPYWALTLVVQEGPYENRRFWANVMLFEGALYTLAQLLKSIGREDALRSGQIPSGEELIGKQVIVSVVKTRDKYNEEQNDDGEKLFKNEVKGFKPVAGSAGTPVSGDGGSLLP